MSGALKVVGASVDRLLERSEKSTVIKPTNNRGIINRELRDEGDKRIFPRKKRVVILEKAFRQSCRLRSDDSFTFA